MKYLIFLILLALALGCPRPIGGNGAAPQRVFQFEPSEDEIVKSMGELGLIRVSGDGFDRQVVFSPDSLEKHTKGLARILGKSLDPRELNFLDIVTLDMLAFHLQADPDEVYDILSQAEGFSDLLCYKLTDSIATFTELTEETE